MRCWVALLVLASLAVGCGSEAPVRNDMFLASGVVEEYCDPFANRPPPGLAAVRRAVLRMAVVEHGSPDLEFRTEDSADPTTATELLDDLRAGAMDRDCERAVAAIDAARKQLKS